jgi:hypothetical protein
MDLLQNAMQTICDSANAYLGNLDNRPGSWLVLTSMVDHGGSLNQAARDKIVMTVYNITREAFASSYKPALPAALGTHPEQGLAVRSPPLYLNMNIMFMANFAERGYSDGLAALSRLIAYFQQTPVFTPQNAPQLSPSIEQLSLDFENLSPVDVNYVMSMLGTRYLPSAFYKVRMIPFDSQAMLSRSYPVSGGRVDAGSAH